jgi:scyllo-inositol 2-dehydrogenase (NADP+)
MNKSGARKKIGLGLVGYGMSGSVFHAPFIRSHAGFETRAVVSSQTAKVRDAFPAATIFASFEELLRTPAVEVVVITVPNALHFQYARLALEAGKHVVLEKPFVNTVAEGEELIALARGKGLVLTVYQNRRWDGDFQTVRQLLEEKAMGEIFHFESHYNRFRPIANVERWRERKIEGSGILFDLGSHLIDQTLQLFGSPDSVISDVQCQREGSVVDDYFHLVFKYGKMRAILHASCLAKEPGPRFVVHGTRGSFVKFGMDPQEEALKRGEQPSNTRVGALSWGEEHKSQFGELVVEEGGQTIRRKVATISGGYSGFYDGLYDTLAKAAAPPVSAEEALEVIRIINSCR